MIPLYSLGHLPVHRKQCLHFFCPETSASGLNTAELDGASSVPHANHVQMVLVEGGRHRCVVCFLLLRTVMKVLVEIVGIEVEEEEGHEEEERGSTRS